MHAIIYLLSFINRCLPKKKTKIVLYANIGFRDNVKALYDYFIENHYQDTYEIVCISNEFYHLKREKNVRYCGLYAGVYHFLTTKYFFYCFGKYPIKPSLKQMVVNLWHGMPLKKIGNLEEHLKDKDFNFFTKVVATSPFFEPIMQSAFQAKSDQMLIAGNTRCDDLFKPITLNDNADKRLLWLPTYRESEQRIDLMFVLNGNEWLCINEQLAQINTNLYIKLHPLELNTIRIPSACHHIIIITDKDLSEKNWGFYRFLGAMDALLTDYSSVFLDYLLVNRPIGFVVNDLEQYRCKRGFIFNPIEDFFVGEKILTVETLKTFIKNVYYNVDVHSSQRQQLNEKVNVIKSNICDDLVQKIGLILEKSK